MAYNLTNIIVVISNALEELYDMDRSANNIYSTAQIITFGVQIIKNTNDLETRLQTWLTRTAAQKVRRYFNTYFEEAHRSLCQTQGNK